MRSILGSPSGCPGHGVPQSRAAQGKADLDAAFQERDAATLVAAYAAEADRLAALGETDAACFYVTQAYVWALEAGMPEADPLRRRLVAADREE